MPIDLSNIPRGNTQPDVNRKIAEFLLSAMRNSEEKQFLDFPCGAGEFAQVLQALFPNSRVFGADLHPPQALPNLPMYQIDASRDFSLPENQQFDVITSVSGVMAFDNISGFVRNCIPHLKKGGLFIISNDNILSVRDRLSFLIFGRVRRFKLFFAPDEGNWNMVPLQALHKLFLQNNLEFVRIQYTSFLPEDLLFFPFALLLYPFQALSILFAKSSLNLSTRFKLVSFGSLLYRHYFIVGRKP